MSSIAALAKPSVLFVTHSAQLSGAELILCDLVRDRYVTSEILLFEDGPLKPHVEAAGVRAVVGYRLNGVMQIRRDSKISANFRFLRTMLRAILQVARMARGHQLVYATSQKAFVVAAFAAVLAKRPLIWHLHDIMTRDHFGARQIQIAIGLANYFAARVIVPSRAVAEAFSAAGGQSKKVRIVPNGVLIPAGTRTLPRDGLRFELGLPRGFLISLVGRLAPWKGQHVMLQAMALLPEAQCIIVGDPLFGEAAYADELRRLVGALQLDGRVYFLGHRCDVPRLMRASDIVVHTSVKPEPFGRVIVEAMLCGTPVVAARAGAVLEILDGGLDALLYPPGDADALANLLRHFQEGKYCRTQLVEQGVERAERLFSVTRMQRDIDSIVAELVTDRR